MLSRSRAAYAGDLAVSVYVLILIRVIRVRASSQTNSVDERAIPQREVCFEWQCPLHQLTELVGVLLASEPWNGHACGQGCGVLKSSTKGARFLNRAGGAYFDALAPSMLWARTLGNGEHSAFLRNPDHELTRSQETNRFDLPAQPPATNGLVLTSGRRSLESTVRVELFACLKLCRTKHACKRTGAYVCACVCVCVLCISWKITIIFVYLSI